MDVVGTVSLYFARLVLMRYFCDFVNNCAKSS